MNLISNLAKLAGGQMHFGLSKNNISLVLCFSSLLPSPPATNCHRYSFSFGANIILFKIQPSSNAKLLRAGPSHTLGQIDQTKTAERSQFNIWCPPLLSFYLMMNLSFALIPVRVLFISDGRERAEQWGEGRGRETVCPHQQPLSTPTLIFSRCKIFAFHWWFLCIEHFRNILVSRSVMEGGCN